MPPPAGIRKALPNDSATKKKFQLVKVLCTLFQCLHSQSHDMNWQKSWAEVSEAAEVIGKSSLGGIQAVESAEQPSGVAGELKNGREKLVQCTSDTYAQALTKRRREGVRKVK